MTDSQNNDNPLVLLTSTIALIVSIISALIAYYSLEQQKKGLYQQNTQFYETLNEAKKSRELLTQQIEKNSREWELEKSAKVYFDNKNYKIFISHKDNSQYHNIDFNNNGNVFPILNNVSDEASSKTTLYMKVYKKNNQWVDSENSYTEMLEIPLINGKGSHELRWIPKIITVDTDHKINSLEIKLDVLSQSAYGTLYKLQYILKYKVFYDQKPPFIQFAVESSDCPECFSTSFSKPEELNRNAPAPPPPTRVK